MTRCEVNFILGHVLELSGKSHTRYNWNATAVYCVNITKRHNTCVRSAGWTSQRSTMIRRSTEPFGTRQRLAMTSMIFTIIIQPTKPPSSIRPSTQPREACTEDVYSPRNLHLGFHFAYICIMLYKPCTSDYYTSPPGAVSVTTGDIGHLRWSPTRPQRTSFMPASPQGWV